MIKEPVAIFWFRRDLRLHDNHALFHALSSGFPVLPIFIFDTQILNKLPDKSDRRVQFIYQTLAELKAELQARGSDLRIFYGKPEIVWEQILAEYNVKMVFCNRDYEPYARKRDKRVEEILTDKGISFSSYKDHVIFEPGEVLKSDGSPYTIFTPYKRQWLIASITKETQIYPSEQLHNNYAQVLPEEMLTEKKLGFFFSIHEDYPPKTVDEHLLRSYETQRDFPAISGTSKLGLHLRFGTISIRHLYLKASTLSETYVSELIWRDFYQMILWYYPHVETQAFKAQYDSIVWENNPLYIDSWCSGNTGYPIVDAGMRELNHTGFMHNRVRMIVASFLTKHLLVDWRIGEAYFAQKLLDFDLAANNGGWQWAAGSGCDAAPYFRVFNPYLQQQKFDSAFVYVKQWVPELNSLDYVKPIVEHEFARKKCIQVYKHALGG